MSQNSDRASMADDDQYDDAPSRGGGTFKRFIQSTFAFNRVGFTLAFVLVYAVLMGWCARDEDLKVPPLNQQYPTVYSQDAFKDLQVISKTYHPYNSHANDDVHDYLLKQIKAATKSQSKVQVVDDVRKTMFGQKPVFSDEQYENAFYYEGNNILVRYPGRNESAGSVLLSAHYDSVATGHGTIDDGTSVVSLLATLRYLCENDLEPYRPVVFNFNNNEEVGLLGAEAFLFHEWSNDVEYFVNLEGAGAFGKPVMFRATDTGAAKHYTQAWHAHGSSVLQQGFQSRLVSSETDYKVYSRTGFRGVDISFYKARSLYHSARDNIHASSVEAISHMFSAALATALSMADGGVDEGDHALDEAVYFEVAGNLIVQPLSAILKWNIAGLVGGPIFFGLLLTLVLKKHAWDVGARGWGRGILSFVLSTGVTLGCASVFNKANPYVMTSLVNTPLVTLLAVFLLVNYTVLGLAFYIKPVHDQKLIVFIELMVLWWGMLLATTIVIGRTQATGLFIGTVLYYLNMLSISLGLIGLVATRPKVQNHDQEHGHEDEHEYGNAYDEEEEANENTSLLGSRSREQPRRPEQTRVHRRLMRLKEAARKSLSYDWSLQFIIMVPIGLLFLLPLPEVTLDALHDTQFPVKDFMSTIWGFVSLFAVLAGVLVMPFIHKTHFMLGAALVVLVAVGGARTMFLFPFTQEWPLAMSFVQNINLDDADPRAIVEASATVPRSYLESLNVFALPSVGKVACEDTKSGATCRYEGLRPWAVPKEDYHEWMQVVTPLSYDRGSKNEGQVVITAPDNRVCQVNFNTTSFPSASTSSPVRKITVYHHQRSSSDNKTLAATQGWRSDEAKDVHTFPDGANTFTLYSLDWDNPVYHLGFEWIPSWADEDDNKLGLTITCMWSEFDQETNVNGTLKRKIPAYDEILEYAPQWTNFRKSHTGLVNVKKYVELGQPHHNRA